MGFLISHRVWHVSPGKYKGEISCLGDDILSTVNLEKVAFNYKVEQWNDDNNDVIGGNDYDNGLQRRKLKGRVCREGRQEQK